MDFNELYKLVVPTREGILNLVDEYTLYCYYTGIDNIIINRAYNAPYRVDHCPSFTVFDVKGQDVDFMWKDHTTAESGTIFNLIQKMEGLGSESRAYDRIVTDFGLDFNINAPSERKKIVLYDTPSVNDVKIRITECEYTSAGKRFWEQFKVGSDLLKFYNVSQISYYWSYESQTAPIQAPDPTFAYRVGGYYQLYSPYADRRYKFRNDLPEGYFFGYLQLPERGEKLILDKSSKDVIFCRRLGLWAVSGKSETTFIPPAKMLELHERFPIMYLMLDDDEAGRRMAAKYKSLYPWLEVRFLVMAKDKTDLCLEVGFDEAKRQILETLD